jgi:putative hemolysin
MNTDLSYELTVIFALVLANALFSGAEIALVTVRVTQLQELAEQGHKSARAALSLKRQPEQLLATIQVGITVISATAAAVGGASVAERLAPLIAGIDLDWLRPHAEQLALAIVIAAISYLSIVLGELVPKSLALRNAQQFALLVAQPLQLLASLARPIVATLTASSNLVLKPLGDRTNFSEAIYSAEELQALVEDAKQSGSLHPQAAEIASRALEFSELTAFEVMVPRREVISLPRHAPMSEIQRIIIAHPHTRLPVHETNTDDVVGYINIKDLAILGWQQTQPRLEDVIRHAHFVPRSKRAVDLLTEMQKLHIPISIVLEEHGGLAGIITIEDLIEELVGEIFTEHAGDAESKAFLAQQDGTWVVMGDASVRELNRELDLDLPEEGDWTTLAGLFIHLAGRIPVKGDRQRLPDGAVLEVLDASPRRIRSLRLRPRAAAVDAPP